MNVIDDVIVPDVPKMIPNEQIMLFGTGKGRKLNDIFKEGLGQYSADTPITVSLTKGSLSVGFNNRSGARGFYIENIDFTNRYIYLFISDDASQYIKPSSLSWNEDYGEDYEDTELTKGYQVGDKFCIYNSKCYPYCGIITEIKGNRISYEEDLPFNDLIREESDGKPWRNWDADQIFVVPTKSEVGYVIKYLENGLLCEMFQTSNTLGFNCVSIGEGSILAGVDLIGADDHLAIFGKNNIGVYGNLLAGANIQSYGSYNLGVGSRHLIKGHNNVIGGSNHVSLSSYGLVTGLENIDYGSFENTVLGEKNLINCGRNHFISGYGNEIYKVPNNTEPKGVNIFGYNNKGAGEYTLLNGLDNDDGGQKYMFLSGRGLLGNSWYQIICGKFNSPSPNVRDPMIVVGCGSDNASRKDSFEVGLQGDVFAAGKVLTGKDPEDSMDLVPKHMLDDVIDDLNDTKQMLDDVDDDLNDTKTDVELLEKYSVDLFNKTNRNEKRITNLEKGISPDPFVTDDTLAYQKDVPSSALPYAEIEKVGGAVTAIESYGKNLLNPALLTEKTECGITVEYLPDEGCFVLNGTHDGSQDVAQFKASLFEIQNTVGTQYTLSVRHISGTAGGTNTRFFISASDRKDSTNSWMKVPVSADAIATQQNDYALINCFWFYVPNGEFFDDYKVQIQLEKGSVATEYSKYVGLVESKSIPVNQHPYVINEEYYNGFDFSKGVYRKSVDRFIFESSTDAGWATAGVGDAKRVYCTPAKLDISLKYGVGFCNHFSYGNAGTQPGTFDITGGVIRFNISALNINTVEEWKTQLDAWKNQGQPLEIYYALETPTVEEISFDNFIEVEADGSLVFVNENMSKVPSTVTYMVKEDEA